MNSHTTRLPSPRPETALLLKAAPPLVISEFVQHAQALRLPPKVQFLAPGQNCGAMNFVSSGCVRVYLLGQDGREITLYRVTDGSGCVLTASCVLAGTPFPAWAVTERATAGFTIAAENFRKWVGRHEFWREYLFRLLATRLAAVLGQFEEAAFDRFDTRLARWFMRRSATHETRIQTTHQTIAHELGSAREVVSRTLERWQNAGLVTLRRGVVRVLQPDRLRQLAGGADLDLRRGD